MYERFGSDSQVTAPVDETLMNLYSNVVPGAMFKVTLHRGLLAVYPLAERAMALAVFQLPSAAMDPTTLIVVPDVVVTSSLKVTATVPALGHVGQTSHAVGVGQVPSDVVVPVGVVVVPVDVGTAVVTGGWLAGNPVFVALV